MESKFHINVCLTGCVHTKDDNPNLPITPDEIVRDIKKCYRLGARVFHIHARIPEATWDSVAYQQIIDKIPYDNIKICVSTSGRHWNDIDKRAACLDCTGIDMASLTLGSLNFFNSVSINHPNTIRELATRMSERNIQPELEVFEPGHLNFAHRLIKEKILKPPYYFNLIFGSPWAMPWDLELYHYLTSNLPNDSHCNIGGIGKYQMVANKQGLKDGFGIRIGLEDNCISSNEKLVGNIREWYICQRSN